MMPQGSPWHDVVAHGSGFYRSPGYFQSGARFVAVHPLRDYPLVVNVGMLESAALATWKRRATLIGLGTLLAALCSALLLRALTTRSRALEGANLHLDAAVNNMSQGLCMFDKDQRLLVFNERFVEIYGLPKGAMKPGCTLVDVLKARAAASTFFGDPEQFAAALKTQVAEGRQNCFTIDLPDGRVIAIRNQPLSDGGWVATHEDITERQRSEERIAHMAQYDALTDLPNRILVREKMDEALANLKDTGKRFAVFIFDLDLFKAVNNSLGHPIGDALLKAVSGRLQAGNRPEERVPDGVPAEVVYRLEQVEVEDEDRRSAGPWPLASASSILSRGRGKIGERIVLGHMGDALRWRSVMSSWVATQPPSDRGWLRIAIARRSRKSMVKQFCLPSATCVLRAAANCWVADAAAARALSTSTSVQPASSPLFASRYITKRSLKTRSALIFEHAQAVCDMLFTAASR